MQWDFTNEDVVKGQVGYGLGDFRRDLDEEIRLNLSAESPDEVSAACALAYDLCHWLARDQMFEAFLGELGDDPSATRLAYALHEPMQANVPMLGAILQRMIMDHVEQGLPLQSALRAVAEMQRQRFGVNG